MTSKRQQPNRETRETEQQVPQLLDERDAYAAGPVVFFTWTTHIGQWQVVHVSVNVEKILGYLPEEMMSAEMPYGSRMHPDDKRRVMEEAKNFRQSQTPHYVQTYRYRHKDGQYRWIEDYNVPVYDGEGKALMIHGYIQDITERKLADNKLRDSEAQFRQLFEKSPVSLMIHDINTGEILDANRNAYQIFGLESLEAIKAYDICLEPPYSLDDMLGWLKKASMEGLQTFEWKSRRIDGEILWEQVHLIPLMINQKQQILAANTNITSLKKAEEGLRRTNRQLQAATNAAQAANEAKTQFLANMSHELRTPLNGLYGMLQLLETTTLTDEQEEYIHMALGGSKAMTRVVEEILNYTSLEKGTKKIQEAPFQVEELLQEIVALHQPTALHKGLLLSSHWEKNLPQGLVGDRFKLKQILGNLVGNAVKFTENGAVHVAAKKEADATNPGRIRVAFQVNDTGIGIPPEKLEYIFQQFTQVDESHNRPFGGLGLGLAVAREQAALLGGIITADSTPGKGSVFALICEVGLGEKA